MITTIVKVTLSQMRRLEAGETVGAHTYDPEHCFYVVDDGLLLPEDSGKYVLRTDDDGESYYYDTIDLTWDEIDNKPATFPPSTHTHPLNQITGVGTIGTTAASTIAYTTSMSGVTTASPALVSAGAIKQECDYIWASVNNINDYCAWQADVDKIKLTVSGNVVTFTNASGTQVSFTTVSSWDDIIDAPTLSISGRTITIGTQSTTWTDTNTAGLSWDAANHAVKAGVDSTLATIPTATTNTQGIIAIGTAATQAAAGNHNHDSAYAAKGHTHTTSITTSSAASYISLNYGTEYAITAGGTTAAFKMPAQYVHPAYTTQAAGLYKIGRDSTGHVVIGESFAVNDATLTIQRNGATIQTFSANASTSVTCNISVPTTITDIGGWSSIGTTTVSTKTISSSSASIASGNADLVTGGAIYSYVENEGGKVKSVKVNGTTYNPVSGVITLPSYPSVNDSTITIKQDGINNQTFTLNGGAKTISLVNTWRPLGTGASDAAAGNHTHGTSIATSTGNAQITLSAGSKYSLNTGGTSYIFQTPADTGATSVTVTGSGNVVSAASYDSTNRKLTLTKGITALTQHQAIPSIDSVTLGWNTAVTYGTTASGNNATLKLPPIPTAAQVGALPTGTTLDGIPDGNTRRLANYLPLSGGTMSGTLKWNSTSLPQQTSPEYFVCIDAFADGGTTKWASLANVKAALGSMPASDVYTWAKAATKPAYNLSEISNRYDTLIGFSGSAPNVAGNVSAIGMAISPEHSANRLAFLNANALYFEYSTDGTNYTQLSLSDNAKRAFVTTSEGIPVGRASGEYTVGSKTRVTITGTNASGSQYVYCSPKKMLINISSSGGMNVLVEYRSGTNTKNDGAWSTFGTYGLSGWSGWNEIPLVLGTLGGSSSQTSNIWQIRLTFIMTSKNTQYPNTAYVNCIRLFADNLWYGPSTMAGSGHLYSFDIYQNAAFPGNIDAISFSENGTTLSNKYAAKSHTHTTLPNRLALNPGSDSAQNSYNEGIRVNQASNGWANAVFGGSANTTQGTGSGVWLLGRRGAAGSTSGATGDFTIEHNGSNGTGLTLYANGNAPAWNGTALAYSNHTHTKAQLTSWLGLGSVNSAPAWGTVKSANGYTVLWGTDQPSGGGLVIGEKNGQTSLQVDGDIYVNEGSSRLAKVSEIGNGTLTLKNSAGTALVSFSANASSNTTYTFPPIVSAIGVSASGLYAGVNGGTTSTICGVIGTTPVSTISISSTVNSSSTDGQIPTAKAVWDVANAAGKVKEIQINGATQSISSAGVVNLPAYPVIPTLSISGHTITIGNNNTTWTDTTYSSGSGITIGTGNKINHSNSVTAQTTQAVYPIKIDAQGHISAYGSAVTSMPASDVSAWAKATTKPAYTLDEVSDGSTRKLTNYLLKTDISDWAKAATKPAYTLDEVSDGSTRKLANYLLKTDISDWAKASTKPAYNYSEISAGNISLGSGSNYINLRTGHASYNGGMYYSTPGNEAMVFAAKNAVTSFIFKSGLDCTSLSNWTGIANPGLQIKGSSVAINKLIADGANGAYNLDVNGTANATTIYENGTTLTNKYAAKSHTHTLADITDSSTCVTKGMFSFNSSTGVLTINLE